VLGRKEPFVEESKKCVIESAKKRKWAVNSVVHQNERCYPGRRSGDG
jgi:hypothetical protein